jgi:hypothetical protein
MKTQDTNKRSSRFDRAIAVFKRHGGILHTAQALRAQTQTSRFFSDPRRRSIAGQGA